MTKTETTQPWPDCHDWKEQSGLWQFALGQKELTELEAQVGKELKTDPDAATKIFTEAGWIAKPAAWDCG